VRIVSIRLQNWLCYRGDHRVDLEGKLYGVTARYAGDPERSNWGGKSSLCESIPFALYGWLNPNRGFLSDDWISDGEKWGGVRVDFEDGWWVERTKERGRRLEVRTSTGAEQDRADEEVCMRMGLDIRNLLVTAYFQQKEMDRFILTPPGDRLKIVARWVGLEKLLAAERVAREDVKRAVAEGSGVRAKLEAARAAEARELAGAAREDLAADLGRVRFELVMAKKKYEESRDRLTAAGLALRDWDMVDAYDRSAEEGRALQRELRGVDVEGLSLAAAQARAEYEDVVAAVGRADGDVAQKVRLVAGKFDGRCPVAGIDCPAKDAVNADRSRSKSLLVQAEADRAQLFDERRIAAEKAGKAADEVRAVASKAERLRVLVERARELKPVVEEIRGRGKPEASSHVDYVEAERSLEDVRRRDAELSARLMRVDDAVAEQAGLAAEATAHEAKLATAREAAAVWRATTRKVAEEAIAEIEEGANSALSAAGLELSVQVRWAREGKDLAKECEACGSPFPASARVKECATCGEERGLNLVQRLDVLLSSQSGAAEDLAGIALQLSASRWLREDRSSAVSFAVLDEPSGAFDPSVRRTFAAALPKMLRAAGIDQALVVAHTPSLRDALPGRVVVECDGKWSAPRVVA
jgi:DNA repair exonuclease SbcCD ATPase subunit